MSEPVRMFGSVMRRLLLPALAGFLVLAPAASADTFTVDSAADAVDVAPGDEACETAGGACTLRAAVHEANALGGADEIVIAAGIDPAFTIAPAGANDVTSGDLDVTEALTIRGEGTPRPVVSAADLDRVLDVADEVPLSVANVEIADGAVTDEDGAGIRSLGDVTLAGVVVRDNTATRNVGFPLGGGIRIAHAGRLLTVVDSRIHMNTSGGSGGGISTGGHSGLTGGTVIRRSLIDGNTSMTGAGGGLHLGGTATIEGSTLTGNDESNNGGAAIFAQGSMAFPSILEISSSTIAGNTGNLDDGLRLLSDTVVQMEGSILSGGVDFRPSCLNQSGSFTSLGGNVVFGDPDDDNPGDGTCAFDDPLDVVGDPMLGALADNGGPTPTLLPALAGAALEAGGGGCTGKDQRGIDRPQGAVCDAGAVELERSSDLAVTVTGPTQPTLVGNPATFTFTVTNTGPHATSNVKAVLTTASEVVSSSLPCFGPPPVACALGFMASGESRQLQLTVRPGAAGFFGANATVSSNPTDPLGANNTAQTQAQAIAPPPGGGPDVVLPPAPRPSVSGLTLSRKRFVPGRGRRRGTTFRMRLSERGTVRIAIERRVRRRWRRLGTIAKTVRAGRVSIAFSGRLGRRALAPGSYRATVTLSARGLRSAPKRVAFRVLR
jgi:CSLREA domain-containing protein